MRSDSCAVPPTATRLPVAIITGFLGSGKTTLLGRLLRDPSMADTAVIVNEFGEIGLDHLLVEAPADESVLLNNGCLCCAVLGDLVTTLFRLHKRREKGEVPPFRRVVVETTGLADPAPILHTVLTDPVISGLYALDSVITVVDAVNGEGQLDHHFESVKQAAVADRLVISKIDLADEAGVGAVRARLKALNPGADVVGAVRGAVPAARLLGGGALGRDADIEAWLSQRAHDEGEHDHGHAHDHHAHGHRHDDRIRTFSVTREGAVRRDGLRLWLDLLASFRGPKLLRVKGILNVEGEPVVVQAVQHLFHEPMSLARWPSADRRSRIVFITDDLDRAEVEATLTALDYATPPKAGGGGLDPAAYDRFVAVMRRFQPPPQGDRPNGGESE